MMEPKRETDTDAASDPELEELTAFLDGELDPQAAEALRARLNRDPSLRAKADALQRTWDILDLLPRPQPSPDFASRTVSRLLPVAPAANTTVWPAHPTTPARRRPGPPFWLAAGLIILAAGGAGYLGHRSMFPALPPPSADPPIEDLPMLRNLRFYRYVDSIQDVQQLDTPEMFGEEN